MSRTPLHHPRVLPNPTQANPSQSRRYKSRTPSALQRIALPCIARETAVRLPIAASAGIAAGLTATACAVQRLESALLCFATLFSNQSLVLCHRPLSPDYRVIRPHSDRDDVRTILHPLPISAQFISPLDFDPRLLRTR